MSDLNNNPYLDRPVNCASRKLTDQKIEKAQVQNFRKARRKQKQLPEPTSEIFYNTARERQAAEGL